MKERKLVGLLALILGIWVLCGSTLSALCAEPEDEGFIIDEEEVIEDTEGGYFETPGKGAVTLTSEYVSFDNIKNGISGSSGLTVQSASSLKETQTVSSNFPYPYYEGEKIIDYFTGKYPVNRNQNPYGSCWAHSAMALTEFYMINHGLTDKGVDIDLSELHTVYYCYRQGTPSIAGDSGDIVSYTGSEGIVDCGGNLDFASQTMMNGRGAVSEDLLPYSVYAVEMNSGFYNPEGIEYNCDARLKNAMEINIDNTALIKQCIMENGAVGVSIHAADTYYNPENNCYFCSTQTKTNHAICLVGWDDDFSREYFKASAGAIPENDGAWLVRNSWNNGADVLSYHNYFWISYEDSGLAKPNGSTQKSAWTFEITDPADVPENNYFYTSQIHSKSYINVPYSANIYTANSGADYEELKAVSFDVFGLDTNGTEIEITVYKSVDPQKGPASGKIAGNATTKATIYLDGKYTIDLKESVIVKAGESFAVVIKRSDNRSIVYERAYSRSNGIAYEVGCDAGQSFYSSDGENWTDILGSSTSSKRSNFVINALTSDYYGTVPGPGPDPQKNVSSFSPVPDLGAEVLYLVKGQSFGLDTVENWQSEEEKIVRISGSTLTARNTGHTIVRSVGGREYEVYVCAPHFAKKSYPMNSGDSINADDLLFITADGVNMREHYPVYYYSSDPAVVKIEAGEVKALSEGRAVLYAVVNSRVYKTAIKVTERGRTVSLQSRNDEIVLSPLQSVKLSLSGVSFKNVNWTSDNGMKIYKTGKGYADGVVYISPSGKITAIGVGETELTCSNGVKINVRVPEPVQREVFLNVDKRKNLKVSGVPSGKANWSIEGTAGPLELWGNGKIRMHNTGESMVKCVYDPYKTEGSGFTFRFKIYAEKPYLQNDGELKTISTNSYSLSLAAGEEYCIVIAEDTGARLYQPAVFKSSNALTAYADENGTIHALKPGTAKLVAKINGRTVRIKVKVTEAL